MALAAPGVLDRRARGLSVNVDEQRVLFRRIEVRRLDAPRVELDAFRNPHAEELGGRTRQRGDPFLELLVLLQHADLLVVRQRDELGDRRLAKRRPRVEGPSPVGGGLIRMGARPTRGRETLEVASVEPAPVEVALRRGIGRCDEVDPLVLLVDMDEADHIEVAAGGGLQLAGVAPSDLEMLPAVAFAPGDEALPVVDPLEALVRIDPGRVRVGEQRFHGAGAQIREHHAVRLLQPVQLLEEDITGTLGTPDVEDIVLARIARDVEPTRRAARGRHNAHAGGRVQVAGLGILHHLRPRVEAVGVVDQRHLAHAGRVELPIDDEPAVLAPAEPVAEIQLLLVHPVERAVDDLRRRVGGQRGDAPALEVLHVEVAFADVGDAVPVRRELRGHQRRRRRVPADGDELVARAVEDPVIAAAVRAPDALGVREDQQT